MRGRCFNLCVTSAHFTILVRSLLVVQMRLETSWKRFVVGTSSAQGVVQWMRTKCVVLCGI